MYRASVIIFLSYLSVSFGALPSNFKKCRFDDGDCMVEVTNQILSRGVQENEALGLSRIDPLTVSKIEISDSVGPVSISSVVTNVNLTGLASAKAYKVSGLKKDPENGTFELFFKTPQAKAVGPYKMTGEILLLPINGAGVMNVVFDNFHAKMAFPTRKYEKNGQTYIRVEKPKVTFDVTGGSVNLSHLISLANYFLNLNFMFTVNLMKPAMSEAFGKIFLERINEVFAATPYDEFFIDS